MEKYDSIGQMVYIKKSQLFNWNGMDIKPEPPKIILCRGRGGRLLSYIIPGSCGLRGESGRLMPDQTPCSESFDPVWPCLTPAHNQTKHWPIIQSSHVTTHQPRLRLRSPAPGHRSRSLRSGVHQVGKVLSPFHKLWHYIKTLGLWHSPWSLLQWGTGTSVTMTPLHPGSLSENRQTHCGQWEFITFRSKVNKTF